MKAVLFLPVLIAAQLAARANDPAYSALRIVGKSRGEEILKHVVELRGKGGVPQPPVWKVVLEDARARGGIREIDVQRGKIVGERTPLDHTGAGPMTLTQLNLDSEGAFTVANQEAQKRNKPFDHVDYALHSGAGNGLPVWELNLSDTKAGHIGTMTIAADSGAIIHQQFDQGKVVPQEDDHQYLARHSGNPPAGPGSGPGLGDDEPGSSESGEKIHDVPSFFRRVQKHFEKRGQQLQNFFTGKGGSDEH